MTNKERRRIRLGYLADGTPRIDDGPSNLNLVGAPRDKKFTSIAAPIGFTFQGSMIYSDPKGQGPCVFGHHRKNNLGHEVYSLNPLQKHMDRLEGIEDIGFNPMQDLDPNDLTWAEDCGQIAEGIIVRGSHGDDNSMHFTATAESLIAGTIGGVSYLYPEEQNLVKALDIISSDEQFASFAQKMLATGNDYLVSCFGRFDSAKWRSSNEMFGVLSTMRTQCSFINGTAMRRCLKRNMPFHFAEMRKRPITLFSTIPLSNQSQLERFTRILCIRAMKDFEDPIKNPVPVLIVADEVANTLARLSLYPNWLSYSAGLGVRILSIWQFITQIVEAFPQSYQSVLGCAGVQIYFRPRQNFDADYISQALGETEILTTSKSVSYAGDINWQKMHEQRAPAVSVSRGQAARRLMMPNELREMPGDRMIILSEDYPHPIMGCRYPYYKMKEFEGLYRDDPYNV